MRLIIVRASDVPTYVQYGARRPRRRRQGRAAEHGGEGLYQPLDLGIARCRMMVAVREGFDYAAAVRQGARLRVATKYVQTAREHFAAKGVHVDLIKLYGSMELAPLVGLADAIVDLVSTGNTLRANELVAVEEIMPVSARLIVNQAALKLKRAALQPLIDAFAEARPRMMKLRRLSTARRRASTRELAALHALRGRAGSGGRDDGAQRSSPTCARAATRRVLEYTRRFDRVEARRSRSSRFAPSELQRRSKRLPRAQREALRAAAARIRALPRAAAAARPGATPKPTARGSASRSRRSTASASTCPAARRRIRRRC